MSLITPKLSGKSLLIYASVDRPEDYELAKTQILYAHSITPEGILFEISDFD